MLFAGRDGDAWCTAARDAAARLGIAIDTFRIGVDLGEPGTPERRFRAAYGLTPSGAALVRPDGIVAWRARRAAGSPGDSLFGVLTKILRSPSSPNAAINPTDIVPAQEARS